MKIDYIKQFYFSASSVFYLIPSIIIFIASLFIRKRIQSYLSLLVVIWVSLVITDLTLCFIDKNLTLSYMLVNIVYDLVGSVFLSLLVCLSNSMVFHLYKIKKLSVFLSSVAPFVISIFLTLVMTVIVYILYARQSVDVELEISEGANVGYVGVKDNEESFGFLNGKETSTPTYIDAINKGGVVYTDNKGMSSANIYIVSGCYASPSLITSPPMDKRKTILNAKSIVMNQDYPFMGYVKGDSISVIPQGASQLSLTKNDNDYMLASSITKSKIEFNSNNSVITAVFSFLPINHGDHSNKYTYDIYVNGRKYEVLNTVDPISRLDDNKKMKCAYQQISPDNHSYSIKGKYFTGIVMSLIPNDVIVFKNTPALTLNADYAFYKKLYPKIDKIYADISNGKLTKLRGRGISHLIINGKGYEINPESEVIIPSGNLVGLVNKSNKIKVYGTADLLFVDNKILNLREITYLQSKLAIFGSSVSDVVKYLFGLGSGVVILRLIFLYFRKELDENLFL